MKQNPGNLDDNNSNSKESKSSTSTKKGKLSVDKIVNILTELGQKGYKHTVANKMRGEGTDVDELAENHMNDQDEIDALHSNWERMVNDKNFTKEVSAIASGKASKKYIQDFASRLYDRTMDDLR